MTVDYSVVVATFRRPDSLRGVLDGLAHQSHRPSRVVVADNDPDGSARSVVDAVRWLSVDYLPLGSNLGPAGGWARAVDHIATSGDRGEWLVVMDDDDPIHDREVLKLHLGHAAEQQPDVAGVGLRGAELDRRRVRLRGMRPVTDGCVDVDYLASSGAPAYRWTAIDTIGFFDDWLFFGFEDLDLGLRLRNEGWRIVCCPLDSLHHVASTNPVRTAWREYFKARALVRICRHHLDRRAVAVAGGRSLLGGLAIAVARRDLGLAAARALGVLDGLSERAPRRRYLPSANPPKTTSSPRPRPDFRETEKRS